MSKTTQSLVAHNSKYIVMPPHKDGQEGWANLAEPDVYVLDTGQEYPIGTKFVDGDRTFHYGYIYQDTGAADRGGIGVQTLSEMSTPTTSAVIEPIGETEISIVDASSTLHQWAGGMFWPYVAPYYTGYRIVGNTATSSGAVVLTLERGILQATTASLALNELYANQYVKLGTCWVSADYSAPVVGVALPTPVAERYMWLQTWGPCIIAGGDEVPGSEAGYHMGQFNFDGTLIWVGWASAASGQVYAGHLINDTGATYTASHYVYLMLAN